MPAHSTVSEPEDWRDIPGYPGYIVSSLGRVASLSSGKLLAQSKVRHTKDGQTYWRITLRKTTAQAASVTVHRLVGWAFDRPQQRGEHVAHLNGDGLDNRAVNLRLGPVSANMRHRRYHGGDRCPVISQWTLMAAARRRGQRAAGVRWRTPAEKRAATEARMEAVMRLWQCGEPVAEIAEMLDCDTSTVQRVLDAHGVAWKRQRRRQYRRHGELR